MVINSTKNKIFTLNTSLRDVIFNDKIILYKNNKFKFFNLFNRYRLGKFVNEQNNKIDNVEIEYKSCAIYELKYLYHIKRLKVGNSYEHMGYAKLNMKQHFMIQYSNYFLKWINNFENLFKFFTICSFIFMGYIGYMQNKKNNTPIIIYKTDAPRNKS